MNKKIILIWVIVYLLLLAGVIVWGSQSIIICWDGEEVDQDRLMELCGITEEFYRSEAFDWEDCPQAVEAVTMVGGCEPDWPTVWMFAGGFSLFYFLISGVIFGIRRALNRVE